MTWSPDRRLAVLLLAVATGTNVPTPLLLLYRERLAMTDASLTAIFGVYALGLMLALAFAGRAADQLGRRRVVLPGAVCAAAASALFVLAVDSELLLYVVRFLQGAASGTVFSVGSAWLVETALRRGSPAGPRTAAVAMTGGFAIGPVYAGLIGQWGPWPLVLPYLLHVVVLLVALLAARSVAESLVRPPSSAGASAPGAFRPGARRTALLVVAPLAVCRLRLPGERDRCGAGPRRVPGRTRGADGAHGRSRPRRGSPGGTAPGSARAAHRTRRGRLRSRRVGRYGACGGRARSPAAGRPGLGGARGRRRSRARQRDLAAAPRWPTKAGLGTVSAAFYATAYIGFGFPLMITTLAQRFSVAPVLAVLAGLCAVLAVQQERARL